MRVAITGADAPPAAEVTTEAQGLVLAVTLGEAGTVAEEDAIQVVVIPEEAAFPLQNWIEDEGATLPLMHVFDTQHTIEII